MKGYEKPRVIGEYAFEYQGQAWYAAMMLWFAEGDGNQCHWKGRVSPVTRRAVEIPLRTAPEGASE